MEYVTVTRAMTFDKGKDGKILTDKKGNQYWRVAIKTAEYGDQWISGFCRRKDDPRMSLKEGARYRFIISENGKYMNFDLPSKLDILDEEVEKLTKTVAFIIENLKISPTDLADAIAGEPGKNDVEDEPVADDLPTIEW